MSKGGIRMTWQLVLTQLFPKLLSGWLPVLSWSAAFPLQRILLYFFVCSKAATRARTLFLVRRASHLIMVTP